MMDGAKTIGVISPGEMGTVIASLLRSRGARVVTTLGGRGERTANRCRDAGLILLDSVEAVVRESNVVISLVPPDAAGIVAARYTELARLAPPGAIFVDANSINPESVAALAEKFQAAGVGFVDASINGLAKNLTNGGTLFLSGDRADEIAQLFGDAMRVKILGAETGLASAMKMLLGGISKGICALFMELAIVAQRNGLLAEMLEASASIYPGVSALTDRMIPTYAHHAARRAVEMSELKSMTQAAGVEPCMVDAVQRLHEQLAAVSFDAMATDLTVATLIEQLADPLVILSPRR